MSEKVDREEPEEAWKDEQRKKQAGDLAEVTSYIMGKHHAELGFPRSKNRWVGALKQRSMKLNCLLSEGILRQILKAAPGDRGDEVLGRLARVLSMKPVPRRDGDGKAVHDAHNNVVVDFVPYEGLEGLTATELRLPLESFKAWEKALGGGRRGNPEIPANDAPVLAAERFRSRYRFLSRTDATTMLGHYELVLPARNQPLITRDQEELHYVTWRYALETRPESAMVAREVLTFRRVDNAFHASMTYKFGAHDLDQVLRVFEGPVVPLGQSLMCVLTAADQTSEGWEDNFDRGRVIFLRRRPIGLDHLVRFGIMATTRADGDFEPCAACVIMLLVDGKIEDIEEYRRLVTVVRPAEELLASDFGGLPERDAARIRTFIENVPEGYREHVIHEKEGGEDEDERRGHDRVLRLQLRRFEQHMPRIRDFIVNPKNAVMNPIARSWKAPGVLLARAEEEV